MGIKSIYSFDDHYRTESLSEELLETLSIDLGTYSDATLEVELSAIMKATGVTGTFRVRVGGTIGVPDGTLAAQLTTSSVSYEQDKAALAIANPATLTLLKLTGLVSGVGSADMRGAVVTIRGATLVTAPPGSGAAPMGPGDYDELWGHDIHFDVAQERGADYHVNASGDWLDVRGRECLRQSLMREYITEPGTWAALPRYGAGALRFVKARNRRGERDELAQRLRACSLRNPRVESVVSVSVDSIEGGLRFAVVVMPRGETQRSRALPVVAELR